MPDLQSVAVYRRSVGASLERVWENVRDWEHLPWLHRESFASIVLEDEGDFGWRARVGLHPIAAGRQIRLELAVKDDRRYVVRTLEGPGAGNEIHTSLTPVDAERTDIAVELFAPELAPSARRAAADAFVALYTRLWDQDEAMMQRRGVRLAERGARAAEPLELDLGSSAELAGRLPLVVRFGGRRVRIVEHEGEWLAHDTRCPHWLGPLEDAELRDGQLVCPWHGYRFDLRSGARCDRPSRMRLAPAPRVEIAGGRVRLVRASG